MHTLVAAGLDGQRSRVNRLLAVAAFGGLPLASASPPGRLHPAHPHAVRAQIWRGISIEVLDQYPTWRRGGGRLMGSVPWWRALQGAALVDSSQGTRRTRTFAAARSGSFTAIRDPDRADRDALYMLAGAAWMYLKSTGTCSGASAVRVDPDDRACRRPSPPAGHSCRPPDDHAGGDRARFGFRSGSSEPLCSPGAWRSAYASSAGIRSRAGVRRACHLRRRPVAAPRSAVSARGCRRALRCTRRRPRQAP